MPDLTIDACPTCGLPAEVLERTDTEAIARCILFHEFTIPIEVVQPHLPEAAPLAEAVPIPEAPIPEAAPVAQVIPFPTPKVSARPEWARRMAWFAFGALAALLLLQAPMAALVLIPLSIPLIAVESARKSWRPLAPRSRVSSDSDGTAADEGREAA